MAYEMTVWQDGDLITAERLNKLEQGVANEQTGPPGEKGADGKDGQTPRIGENGNWWIGEQDTGISATGPNREVWHHLMGGPARLYLNPEIIQRKWLVQFQQAM